MQTLLLAFANSEQNPLPDLRKEDDEVYKILSPRVRNSDFRVEREQYATREKIWDQLHHNRNNVCLFWFSGHAERDSIALADGPVGSINIAAKLRECPQIKLVGLNGCSTKEQTQALLASGVPMVIATSAPVNDASATEFGILFFKYFAGEGHSVRYAFEQAIQQLNFTGKDIRAEVRGYASRTDTTPESVWELVVDAKSEHLLDEWRLPKNVPPKPEDGIADAERAGQQRLLHLATEKRNRLQTAHLLETDEARRFAYEKKIDELDAQIAALQSSIPPTQ